MIFELKSGNKFDIDKVLAIAKQAGAGILKIYNGAAENINITYKEDESPLTAADAASHNIISEGLAGLMPDIPLLSEEGKDITYEERKNWEYYWCIDPLDGTKEFIKRNGEFTVNIALIHKNVPVFGVIYVPVTSVLYYGAQYVGSWKITKDNMIQALVVGSKIKDWVAVGSRTHSSAEEAELLAKYNITDTIAVGSSLKFCMIAEGNAQVYYRHGPTMEWDTAAGHAIAVYSGAFMTRPDGSAFTYNKPSLLNGSFLCSVKLDNY